MVEIKGKDIVFRIDSVLKQRNLKRKAVADAVGISLQPFTSWANRGSIPGADIAFRIADYLNVSVEWLLTGQESAYSNEEKFLIAQWRELDAAQKDTVKTLLDKWEADRIAEKKQISDA